MHVPFIQPTGGNPPPTPQNSPSECLTEEQLWQAAGGHMKDPKVLEHLETCEECRTKQANIVQG